MQNYIIDGQDKVIGRAGSQIAKLLLNGNNVNLVNAEKMVMTGHERDILEKYKQLLELKDKANPEHSPYWPRRPDMFVKRIIRGMLPYKKPSGKAAFKRLKVFIGVPEEFKSAKMHEVKTKKSMDIFENTMSIKQITEKLGYKV
ncbi:MAG: 50S ribosomal protein L13 [Candidatus Micrarchaeota archaeon]|nr:50S ribosomal protein L13 [Candidatus Micrarchaeota archaeon]MDE1834947.1 50S ribosomal protein L13 [Candidatus Micrarchaeota archaeon]MDE1859014.1 50S ribosomal protein L13 [Candidatus Micrarchaeota archaeon]